MLSSSHPSPLLLIALLALAPPSSRADEPADQVQLEEQVIVVGHYDNGIQTSDAASAGVILRELVEDRPILRPGEVLELVPGLVITQHSGAGKANQYYLRGFNLDHGTDFATALDGVPLNLRTHAHGQGYTDLNWLIPELVGRAEYFKGPYFASKGDFASAGAADIHYLDVLPQNIAQVTGGQNAYGRALLAGSPALGGGNLLYGLELMHEDGPWLNPDDYRRYNGILRYTRSTADAKWSLTALGYYGTWNATDQIPERAVQDGAISRFGGIDPTTGGATHRFSLSGVYERALAGGFLTAQAYGVQYRLNLFSNFTYFLDRPDTGDQFEQADRRWQLGTSGKWSRAFAAAGLPMRVTAGWEGRQDRVDPVALYDTTARVPTATVRRDVVRETSGAAFAEGEVGWTPWLRTIAGVRYDRYLFDVASDRPENSGHRSAGRASPKISAILGPFARTELFANAGLGFHSNDARGAVTTVDPKTGEPVSPVTPLVRTQGEEVGLRTELIPGVQASVALWRLDMGSELVFVGDAGTTEPSRPSRRQGVEVNARWRPLRWLLFDLDGAWSSARFTDPDPVGNRIPGSIESMVSAGATIHALGPWTASVYVRYFGPRPLVEDDSVRSSASTLFNAQASYQVTRAVRLQLDVFNLLDAQVDDISYFYASRLPGEPAGGVGDVHFHPAESRTVRAGLAFAF